MSQPAQGRVSYQERIRLPLWILLLLGAVLGGTAGGMTGVAIAGALEGGEAAAFYLTFGLSALIALFVLVNFASLSVTVSDAGIETAFGMFRKRLEWSQIKSVEPQPYRWARYGGWGIRFGMSGGRAWSQLLVNTGVAMQITEGGKERELYVSSRRPEELAAAVQSGIGVSPGVAAPPGTDP